MKMHPNPGDEGNPYFECEECHMMSQEYGKHWDDCPVKWRSQVLERLAKIEKGLKKQ